MLLYNNRKAHLFSLSDVPIYNSILILLQAPPVTVYKPLFFYVSSTILMTAYILKAFSAILEITHLFEKRSWWDSNPRAPEGKRISSAPRYDHFDTTPKCCQMLYNLIIITESRLKRNPFYSSIFP